MDFVIRKYALVECPFWNCWEALTNEHKVCTELGFDCSAWRLNSEILWSGKNSSVEFRGKILNVEYNKQLSFLWYNSDAGNDVNAIYRFYFKPFPAGILLDLKVRYLVPSDQIQEKISTTLQMEIDD